VDHPDLAAITEPLLIARRVLREQLGVLHRRLLAVVRQDEVCRRLMTVPGVGPVVALTFRATVDVAARFKNSKAVGAVFGLTPRRHQSGEIDRMGSISKSGDAMVRTVLFGAAQVMLTRTIRWSWLKAWGMKIARHRGMKRAIVAVARRMAVIMHRMWADGTEFRWSNTNARRDRLNGTRRNEEEKTRVPPTGGMMSLAGTMVEVSPSVPLCLPSVLRQGRRADRSTPAS